MDCHAVLCTARNDGKTPKAENVFCKKADRILGFLMRNRGFQAVGAGIYLSGNEQAHRAESTIYRKKTKSKTKQTKIQ